MNNKTARLEEIIRSRRTKFYKMIEIMNKALDEAPSTLMPEAEFREMLNKAMRDSGASIPQEIIDNLIAGELPNQQMVKQMHDDVIKELEERQQADKDK